jgi:hypothetical protein
MKIGIVSPISKISSKISSHRAAWAAMWCNQLKHSDKHADDVIEVCHDEDWDRYDMLYLYHGMEFKGSLNLFGGASAENSVPFKKLLEWNKPMVSLDIEMPDYGEHGKGRLKSCSPEWAAIDWDALSEKCKKINCLKQSDLEADHLIIGDSHSFSMYVAGSVVNRNDGQTLHGALKLGLESFITDYLPKKKITFYFGNIDIRHHLMRHCSGNEEEVVGKLTSEYEKQIQDLEKKHNIKVEVIAALPIENESRRIPKTGFYKGTPFFGTWEQRSNLVSIFNQQLKIICNKNDWELYTHPEVYKNVDGELSFDVMEKPKSVHLSREFYRWDFEKDELNSKLKEESDDGLFTF